MNVLFRVFFVRSTYLLCGLVTLAIVAHFIPTSGTLVVGVLVASSIELTRNRYRENTLSITLIMFSTIALLWGWLGPYIGAFARPAAMLMFFVWGAYCLNTSALAVKRIGLTSAGVVLFLSFVITILNSHHIIGYLLWGYDNSAHVPALSQVYRHSGFLYSGNIPELFTFSNYVNGYPPLQSGTWALIMSIANIQVPGGYEILNFYGFFYFGTGLLIIALIAQHWLPGLSHSFTGFSRRFIFLLICLLIAFSQASYMLWLGFPSFLWTCCIIIAITELVSRTENRSHRVLICLLGMTLVNYSYPLLSPVLILVLISEVIQMTRSDVGYFWKRKRSILVFGFFTWVLNFTVVLKSLNVRHYLDDVGGIQPIALRNLIFIVMIVAITCLIYRHSLKSLPVISIAFFSSIINFGVLALLSQRDLGSVSYYPQKAGYLALILGFASMGSMLTGSLRFADLKSRGFVHLFVLSSSIAVLWFSVSATSDPNLAKYGFASTSVVLEQLKHGPSNPNRECLVQAMDATIDLNFNSNAQTILFSDDLNTRWINGVRGRLTDATYSISIPFGQGTQTLPEILKGWFAQYPNSQLLILSADPPTGLEEWGNKIEYRELSCS